MIQAELVVIVHDVKCITVASKLAKATGLSTRMHDDDACDPQRSQSSQIVCGRVVQ
jgi:hypothetical protein